MKIGIITFHKAVNYGATLQAFALQKKISLISESKIDVEIIDYRSNVVEDKIKPFAGVKTAKKPKEIIRGIIQGIFRIRKSKSFQKFEQENMRLSSQMIVGTEQIKNVGNEYDKFITGSDQVWNLDIIGNDNSYLLDFVKNSNKKYSYAASCGLSEIPGSWNRKMESYLRDYNLISVREGSLQKALQPLLNRNVEVCLDPTLLLDSLEYKKVESKPLMKEKYVFMYLVGTPIELKEYAKNFARENVFKIIDNKTSYEFFMHCSPSDFLSWIDHAEYVFTNSFHGTAFSIIFNKKFFIELKYKEGFNHRAVSLMNTVGIFKDYSALEGILPMIDVDYETVNGSLNQSRNQSIDFIRRILIS